MNFTMYELSIALTFIASYLLGGIPAGYLIGKRFYGLDIRQYGSGNPGTANVYRTLGKWAGISTFAIDFLKGFVPAWFAMQFYVRDGHWWIPVTAGALSIAGHIWTIFLRFKGGKGVATAAGVFMALLPIPTAGAFVVFGIAVAITSHISVGSMAASVALPVLCYFLTDPNGKQRPFTILALVVCGLIFYTHIANIRRILKGKELSFQHKDGAAAGKKEGGA